MSANGQINQPRRSRLLSTTVPFGFDFDPVRFLNAYRALGCSSAQFYRNPNSPPTVAEALAAAAEAGMPFDSIHGLFGAEIDPSSPDREHRDACLQIYEREGRLALELGVDSVVVHPSANRADYQSFDPGQAQALEAMRWPHFDDFAKRLIEIGERLSVTYLIENVPYVFPLGHNPSALAERIRFHDHPRLRMCFDTGHAHVTDDVARAMEQCASVIDYLHIHDNDGIVDNHRMPGDGTIHWARFSAALAKVDLRVPCMLEVFYPVEKVEELAAHGLGGRLASVCAVG